jgi:hypothetical protein
MTTALAAVRARLENDRLHAHRILRESAENHRRYPWVTLEAQDLIDLLAAYDAQAARLAVLEAAVQAWAQGAHRERPPHCVECNRLYDVSAGAAGEGRWTKPPGR